MASRKKTRSAGLSPGKVIVIGILSMVLLLTIVIQFGGRVRSGAIEPVAANTTSEGSESRESPGPAATPASAAKRSESPWPTFNVAEVVTRNPFMLPEVLLTSREAAQTLPPSQTLGETEQIVLAIESSAVREMRRRQTEFLAGLRAQGVDMILRSPRGSVARIGELSLREGDIHEGLRVVEIGRNGVIFAPVTVAEGQP